MVPLFILGLLALIIFVLLFRWFYQVEGMEGYRSFGTAYIVRHISHSKKAGSNQNHDQGN